MRDLTAAEWREWEERTHDSQRKDGLRDPLWRLRWLYKILADDGQTVRFEPNKEQITVIWAVYEWGWQSIIIPKARQLGMSTVICIIGLDITLFRAGARSALVDKTNDDAAEKMKDKIQFGWDNLPPTLRGKYHLSTRNDGEFGVGLEGADNDADSKFFAGISYRGSTIQFLHVSELGWIQAKEPKRAREIIKGSFPAAERSSGAVKIVESTWEGGKLGALWPLVDDALKTPEEQKGPKSWRVLFFGWHTNPKYATRDGFIDEVSAEYFKQCEERHLKLTKEQKKWYAGKRREDPIGVKQEYPTFIEECWEKPVQGAIYGEEMAFIRGSGRLKEFPIYQELPLFTAWDVGMSDSTSIWLIQPVGNEVQWIAWHEAEGKQPFYYVDVIRQWEGDFEKKILRHFLPHDSAHKGHVGTHQQQLVKLGLDNTTIVPAIPDIWQGIQLLRPILRRSIFHTRTDEPRYAPDGGELLSGFACLESYRKKVEQNERHIREHPVHDHASHTADAARMWAQACNMGLIPSGEPVVRKRDRTRSGKVKFAVGG